MADDSGALSSSSGDFHRSISKEGHVVFKRTRKRVPLVQRSLAVVLASLQGVQVVIELKNDNEITGTVDETDSNVNVTLQNVRQVSASTLSRCSGYQPQPYNELSSMNWSSRTDISSSLF